MAKTKKTYVIYRHGANAANQPRTTVRPIAIVSAETPEAAKAECAEWCYANQFLNWKHLSRASRRDVEMAQEHQEAAAELEKALQE